MSLLNKFTSLFKRISGLYGPLPETPKFQKLKRMFRRDEGLRLVPYKCPAGFLTVGYGHNLEARAISEQQAEAWLWEDTMEAEAAAIRIFGLKFWNETSENRQFAIVNMIYNLGESKFRMFVQTITFMKARKWIEAANTARQSLWAQQVKTRADRVCNMLAHDTFPY